MGIDGGWLTVEQNLKKAGHPMNDPVVGVSRNHFTLESPNGCQVFYINYYVNLDTSTKLRIRLESTDIGSN